MASGNRAKTILIVDDERFFLQYLSGFFTDQKYQVKTASDGKEALEQARRLQPDAIVLDVVMPAPDGVETCKMLKANEATRQIPVIILTGREDLKLSEVAFKAGAEAALFKSIINVERLLNMVEVLIRSQKASDPSSAAQP